MVPLVEAARLLGLSPQTLRTQVGLGRLKAYKRRRQWFIPSDEVERYAKESLRSLK